MAAPAALIGLLALSPLCGTTGAQERETIVETDRLAQRVIELTNAERAKEKLPPLKLQANLRTAARWLAQDFAENRYFDHTDRQGRSIDPRLPDFGYKEYRALGENIAAGQNTAEAVVAGWMRSPGHRANILNRSFREIGVGTAAQKKSRYRRYWVQDFGTRADSFPLVINEEAGQTKSANVRLYIYGDGWAEQMRFSNDGQAWTPWESYRARRDWKLEPGSGRRTVLVELTDGASTRRAQDSIELRE